MTEGDVTETGYLGRYGALVVPAPPGDVGGWFVTVAAWDEDQEGYVSGTAGPIFASREEAMQEAGRVLDWLIGRAGEEGLDRLWERMQQAAADQVHPELERFSPWPWS